MKKHRHSRLIFFCFPLLSLALFMGCRKDFDFEPNIENLKFSEENILLDPVLNFSNSPTYLIKVFNTSDTDIEIPSIYLKKKSNSYYRINVDGRAGYEFSNVPLRAKDSLTIFLSVAAEKPLADLYKDQIVFQDLNKSKEINVLTLIAKAKYYYPEKGQENLFLNENTTFNKEMYHVISGNLVVAEGIKLNIEAGTKVLFYENGRLSTAANASLEINGELDLPVVFKTYKNEIKYDTIPSQWRGINVGENARLTMNYAEIIGAENALNIAEAAQATIKNTKIYNSGVNAIEANHATIKATNLVINNALQNGILLKNGGNYEFSFCSIADMWRAGSWGMGENLPMYVSDFLNKDGVENLNPLTLKINNSILYGNANNGLQFDLKGGIANSIEIRNSLIKNDNPKTLDLKSPIFKDIITQNPKLKNTNFFSPDLGLKDNSPALGKGNAADVKDNQFTIEGKPRATPPNLGAY
ncbi:right-handed parallel beta-helix repeat-containing protein [Ornithobacterium rhinotracheale]|uniref:right-handed parallel beta-helix repeat-containing protein n=1 Tax=Ornithobacterium rhinotracheale TaxID=28251 RepID=UPI001FF3957E|nr:right-handed parallel beta-helix repeat-containing protein [Ornithobacterium rhinotracheale]MCK0200494.1 right-handed parallel beta-helix repeat-containing protein [Ornithobacterium rhinotracheale]UVD87783.1 right-handed parallel beta-helix repeat-containing protein [Ornithobacterium rhinotracheale]